MGSRRVWVVLFTVAAACGGAPKPAMLPSAPATPPPVRLDEATPDRHHDPAACGSAKLRVAFYKAGQALSALVTLPDGRHILVDAGESASRPGCGAHAHGARSGTSA